MNNHTAPCISKWAFFLGDGLLLFVAGWLVFRHPVPLDVWQAALVVVAVAVGAWIAVTPFILEYRAALRFAEADQLASAVSQIERLESVGDEVRLATGQWQTVQEHCQKAVFAAHEIAERMNTEAKNFADFMQKANDTEKSHLRLEVEKARRSEGEWLQIIVRLLDHVYALYVAGARSGQPMLQKQLGQFQVACREIVRRVGLVPIEAGADEPFDEQKHQYAGPGDQPPQGATVEETVATGYSFQGRLLRPPLVRVKAQSASEPSTTEETREAAQPGVSSEPVSDAPVKTAADQETGCLPAPVDAMLDEADPQLGLDGVS